MIYKAQFDLTQQLINAPETGMGYQVIRQSLHYTKLFYIVYNAELIVSYDNEFSNNLNKIIRDGFEKSLSSASTFRGSLPLSALTNKEWRNQAPDLEGEYFAKSNGVGTGAIDNPPVQADGGTIFCRLSAYKNDFRIDTVNNCLKPGSYTTTSRDFLKCKQEHDNPNERYALPNDEEIKWMFIIKPDKGDMFRPGIVQPANGRRGGGEECLFDDGTSKNTYIPPPQDY